MNAVRAMGAVLTGGGSRRMGTDKALVAVDGAPMARRVTDALATGGCSPVIAVGGDAAALAALGLDVVGDGWPGEGPLGAIVTALELAAPSGSWTFVAACDLPWLDAATVVDLRITAAAAARSGPPVDVVCARSTRREPLCSLWSPTAVGAARSAFAGGARAVQALLDGLRVIDVDVDPALVRNANEPSDLPDGRLPT